MTTVREHRLCLDGRPVTLLEGPAGWGEISPWPGYPCDPVSARAAAEEAAVTGWPAPVRESVACNVLDPGHGPPPSGFSCVKIKVGRGHPDADVERVAQVRDVLGPTVAIRVDANGAWDVDTAAVTLTRLARYDLELAEQPVATLDDLAALRRRVAVAIAADECVRNLVDARRLRALDAADALVLKVQPLGGVRAALAIAETAGVPAIPSSMMETSVGLAAGLALACALPELAYACGLATAPLVVDVVDEPLVPGAGGMLRRRVIAPDPALLERYAEDT